jgi:hypothetical protein
MENSNTPVITLTNAHLQQLKHASSLLCKADLYVWMPYVHILLNSNCELVIMCSNKFTMYVSAPIGEPYPEGTTFQVALTGEQVKAILKRFKQTATIAISPTSKTISVTNEDDNTDSNSMPYAVFNNVPFERIIPQDNAYKVIPYAGDLLKGLNELMPMFGDLKEVKKHIRQDGGYAAIPVDKQLRMLFKGGFITMRNVATDTNTTEYIVACNSICSETTEIAFNPLAIENILKNKAIDAPVIIEFSSPNRIVVFRDYDNKACWYIMPIEIR